MNRTFFTPTLNIFNHGIVINYKKVGTRFLGELVSLPRGAKYKQLDVAFIDFRDTNQDESLTLDYLYKSYSLKLPWDDSYNHLTDSLNLKWNSISDFFIDNNVANVNELFLENKTKDIIFLIRDPFTRFMSGLIQIEEYQIEDLKNNERSRAIFKVAHGIGDADIKNLVRYYQNVRPMDSYQRDSKLNLDIWQKFISYLIEFKINTLYRDLHTQEYLNHFTEMIYNLKDINGSKNCINFFSKLYGSNMESLDKFFKSQHFESRKASNKGRYDNLIDHIFGNNIINELTNNYIKGELVAYDELKSSKFYVDIS